MSAIYPDRQRANALSNSNFPRWSCQQPPFLPRPLRYCCAWTRPYNCPIESSRHLASQWGHHFIVADLQNERVSLWSAPGNRTMKRKRSMIVLKEVLSCEGHRAFFFNRRFKRKKRAPSNETKNKRKKRLKFPAVPWRNEIKFYNGQLP